MWHPARLYEPEHPFRSVTTAPRRSQPAQSLLLRRADIEREVESRRLVYGEREQRVRLLGKAVFRGLARRDT